MSERKTFHEQVHEFEARLIADALNEAGQITRAARLLGFKHHQSLISLLDGRHSALRTAPKFGRGRNRSVRPASGKKKRHEGDWFKEAL